MLHFPDRAPFPHCNPIKMHLSLSACALLWAAVVTPAICQEDKKLPPVKQIALSQSITRKALASKAHELEDIAYSTPLRNRVMGSEGHNLTVEWITGYLDQMSDYYTYEVQPFIALFSNANGTLEINGEDVEVITFEYSPSDAVEAEVVAVDNLGCEAADYPDAVDGAVALISRGECEFGLKSALAGAAGAVAAIIYNNEEGLILGGTLGAPPREEGPYVPTLGVSDAQGADILDLLDAGDVTAVLNVNSEMYNLTT